MIIGIDASKTALKQKTGIDNTAYQIILNLEKIDVKNTYYLYSNKPIDKSLNQNKNFQEKLIPFPKFWNKFRLPLALLRDKPDKFLELTNSIPSFAPRNTAVFVHDLAFKLFPDAYSSYELILQEAAIKAAISRAKIIIFSSKANKNDFLKYYKFPEKSIRIVPLAFDSDNYKKIDNPKQSLKINAPYFIFVGRLEKRKNIVRTIKAFELYKEKSKTNHKLVLIGKKGYGFKEIEEKISSSKYKADILIPGFVNNEKLANLYASSIGLVYSSLYEGFGLPMLEAMACGTPVITSDVPTLKEIAEDAALLVDPKNEKEIAEAMDKIISDKNIRKDLIAKGENRVREFSWDKTGKEILKIVEEMQ